jgi:hypothetical protein
MPRGVVAQAVERPSTTRRLRRCEAVPGEFGYRNNYVVVAQMQGHGDCSDPRLGVRIVHEPEMVTPKLAGLQGMAHHCRGR